MLRKVSDHLMSIPSMALERVLRVLAEVDFVKLVESGRKITAVIPNIPIFDDVYKIIGDYTAVWVGIRRHSYRCRRPAGRYEEAYSGNFFPDLDSS